MELSAAVKEMTQDITAAEYQNCQDWASGSFKFERYSYRASCNICNSHVNEYVWGKIHYYCFDCAAKIGEGVIKAVSVKRIREKNYSKGVGFGYQLATKGRYGTETIAFLRKIIADAKVEGKTVHFLGRDMDVLFIPFNIESNVNYLPGWNRNFCYESETAKQKLARKNDIQPGDYIVDTGFAGSIINDIRTVVPEVKGFLLSGTEHSGYTCCHLCTDYDYKNWICEIENINRAREVRTDPDTSLPEEYYKHESWYEDGVFSGFKYGVKELMQ